MTEHYIQNTQTKMSIGVPLFFQAYGKISHITMANIKYLG